MPCPFKTCRWELRVYSRPNDSWVQRGSSKKSKSFTLSLKQCYDLRWIMTHVQTEHPLTGASRDSSCEKIQSLTKLLTRPSKTQIWISTKAHKTQTKTNIRPPITQTTVTLVFWARKIFTDTATVAKWRHTLCCGIFFKT